MTEYSYPKEWRVSGRLKNVLIMLGWTDRKAVLAGDPQALWKLPSVGVGTVASFLRLQDTLSRGGGSGRRNDPALEAMLEALPAGGVDSLRKLLKQRGLNTLADLQQVRSGRFLRETQPDPVTWVLCLELFRRARRRARGKDTPRRDGVEFAFIEAVDRVMFPFEARRVFHEGVSPVRRSLRGVLPERAIVTAYMRLITRYCGFFASRFGVRPAAKIARLLVMRDVKDLEDVERLSPADILAIDSTGRGAMAQLAEWCAAVLTLHGRNADEPPHLSRGPIPPCGNRDLIREVHRTGSAGLSRLFFNKPLPQTIAALLDARFDSRPPCEHVEANSIGDLIRLWRRFGDHAERLVDESKLRSPAEKTTQRMLIKGSTMGAIGRKLRYSRERIRQIQNGILLRYLADDLVLTCLGTLDDAVRRRWLRPTPERLASLFRCREDTAGRWLLRQPTAMLWNKSRLFIAPRLGSGTPSFAKTPLPELIRTNGGALTWQTLPGSSVGELLHMDAMLSRRPDIRVVEAGRYGERTSYRHEPVSTQRSRADEKQRALRDVLIKHRSLTAKEVARSIGAGLNLTNQLLRKSGLCVSYGASRWGLLETIPVARADWPGVVSAVLAFLATVPGDDRVHLTDVPLPKRFASLLPVHVYAILWMDRKRIRNQLNHFPRDYVFPGTGPKRGGPRSSLRENLAFFKAVLAKAGRPVTYDELRAIWPGPSKCPTHETAMIYYVKLRQGIVSFGNGRIGLPDFLPIPAARRRAIGRKIVARARELGRTRFTCGEVIEWFPRERAFASQQAISIICRETEDLRQVSRWILELAERGNPIGRSDATKRRARG